MAIKGLTDRVGPAFPRLGKLRKGDAQPQAGGYGKDLEYFRFTSDRPEVVEAFTAAYGEKPALINIYLPYPTVAENFEAWKEKWAQSGLVHRCDGETMTVWLGTDGKYYRGQKPCPYAGKQQTEAERKADPSCDELGRLSLVIPELVRAGFVGYVTLETHSIHDILSIQASLLAAAEARGLHPHGLKGIPWVLRRQPEKISTPMKDGKRARREKWLVKLEPQAEWVQLQMESAHAVAMLEAPKDRTVNLLTGEITERVGEAIDGEVINDPQELAEMTTEIEGSTDSVSMSSSMHQPTPKQQVSQAPENLPPPPGPERAQIMDDIRTGVGTLHWDSATLKAEIQKIRADVTRVSDLNDNELQELKANVNSAVDAKTKADEELKAAKP